jgi:hypothetical protein
MGGWLVREHWEGLAGAGADHVIARRRLRDAEAMALRRLTWTVGLWLIAGWRAEMLSCEPRRWQVHFDRRLRDRPECDYSVLVERALP